MTEAIKQWIADLAQGNAGWTGLLSDNSRSVYSNGLTKGIEIAEGFTDWANERYTWVAIGYWDADNDETFTTSQLLETYLKTL